MNKLEMAENLKEVGIVVETFEFSQNGYTLDLRLNLPNATGWEELENFPFVGLEVARARTTGAYSKRVLIIPCNRKEFIAYIRKHLQTFGAGRTLALAGLSETIEKYGSKNAKITLAEFIKNYHPRQNKKYL